MLYYAAILFFSHTRIRRTTTLRPYGSRRPNPDDAVDVVGHDNELVEVNPREPPGEVSPGVRYDLPGEAIIEQ
jgi:hypothetical protein